LLCPIGVEFNSVSMGSHVLKQMRKGYAIPDAGIERRESFGKGQPTPESFGLASWQREKA